MREEEGEGKRNEGEEGKTNMQQVHGEAHITSYYTVITISNGLEGELFLLKAKEIKKASFKSVHDGYDMEHRIGVRVGYDVFSLQRIVNGK